MLVEDFEGNKAHFMAPSYSEQAARHDFIDCKTTKIRIFS